MDLSLTVTMEDFKEGLREFNPSLSKDELDRYTKIANEYADIIIS